MSRLKQYAHSLVSGYVLIGANVIYTLASVPLALSYLSKAEFGLWALTTQLAGYIALLDFGMSGALSRILVDYKDRKADGQYGSVIQTAFLVNLVQGLLVLVCGVGLAFVLGSLLQVPVALGREFRWLVIWQTALLAGSFSLRVTLLMLGAHQRYDLVNYSQALMFALNFGVMWLCFAAGSGIFSMVWAQVSGQTLAAVVTVVGCVRLDLFPPAGAWGRASKSRFVELFVYGRDMFLYSLGYQLLYASQTVLITRTLGLESGAVWSVCTRAFTLITQVVHRIFDYSCAALAEMIVRGERERLFSRFRSMMVFSGSLSVVMGVVMAGANQPFVQWWTSGKVSWSPVNDWLLAAWLPALVVVRGHTGLVGLTKAFGFLRYLFFLEGLFFVGTALVALRYSGITAMVIASLVATLSFSLPYGTWRTSKYFNVRWRSVVFGWMSPSVRLVLWLLPLAALVSLLSQSLPTLCRLGLSAGVTGTMGAALLVRFGLDEATRQELARRLPTRFRWLRSWVELKSDTRR